MNKCFGALIVFSAIFISSSTYSQEQSKAPRLSLSRIDAKFVAQNMKLDAPIRFNSEVEDSNEIPGCSEIRKYNLYEEGKIAQVEIALCEDG